jgi:hypothetical protein
LWGRDRVGGSEIAAIDIDLTIPADTSQLGGDRDVILWILKAAILDEEVELSLPERFLGRWVFGSGRPGLPRPFQAGVPGMDAADPVGIRRRGQHGN